MDGASTAQLPVAEFVHQCLDLTKSTIRVLQILPGRKKDPISCTLKHVPRAKDTYLCLSYMWGDAKSIHSIIINGRCFSVRGNLWKFLHLARKLKIRAWLWIDAICIKQSNMAERNHQVQQMANIYREAISVLVYPGETPWLLTLAARLTWYLPKRRLAQVYGPSLKERLGSLHNTLVYRIFESVLLQVARFQYWERSWIAQEVLLARECFVVTRSGLTSWDDLRLLYSREGLCSGKRRAWAGQFPVTELCEAKEVMKEAMRQPLGYQSEDVYVKFSEIFTGLHNTKFSDRRRCTDIRDHVYSLLGLTDRSSEFEVDYQKPLPALFLDTIEHFVPSILSSGPVHHFIQQLLASLRVAMRCYCRSCARNLLKGRPAPPFNSSHRVILLDVYEAENATSEFRDTCAVCQTDNLLPHRLEQQFHGPQTMVRMAPDKMYCFSEWEGSILSGQFRQQQPVTQCSDTTNSAQKTPPDVRDTDPAGSGGSSTTSDWIRRMTLMGWHISGPMPSHERKIDILT